MQTIQQQIGALQTSIKRQRLLNIALLGVIVAGGFIAAVRPAGDAAFDTITCKEWKVVDKDGKWRIMASTLANGYAGVTWFDKDGNVRIAADTFADGNAGVAWLDKDGKARIDAATAVDGTACVIWHDKDGKTRFGAATLADGTVLLPTKDLEPPKKP